MGQSQPRCQLVKSYRKNNENYLQVSLPFSRHVLDLPAQSLLLEHRDKLAYFKPEDICIISALAQDKLIPIIESQKPASSTLLYLVLIILQLTFLVAANIMSAKVMHVFGIDIVAGALCFPLTYSISDIIAELYGFYAARRAIVMAIWANILVMLLIEAAIIMPPASFWPHQIAYQTVLHSSATIFFASIIAFGCGDLFNSYILVRLKASRWHMPLFARLVFSCMLGFLLDSIIFLYLAHRGAYGVHTLINMIVHVYFHKLIYECVTAVMIYGFIQWARKWLPENSASALSLELVKKH